jgi:hypothetical protein
MMGAIHKLWLLLLANALLACGGSDSGKSSWQEQVQLSDGRIVVVERQLQYHDTRELGGLAERIADRTILRFKLGDKEVLPDLTAGIPAPEDSNPRARSTGELPLIFDVDAESHTYFVITIVNNCNRASELGLTVRPYFEYRVVGDHWERHPVSLSKLGRKTNLLLKEAKMGDPVSLEEKARSNDVGYSGFYTKIADRGAC